MKKTQLQRTKKKTKLSRKRNELNKEIKRNERRQKRENILEDIDLGSFFELATANRKYVNGLNLHEIKSEILEDHTGDFELIGSMLVGDVEQKTNNRFKNVDDFESYINAIDNGFMIVKMLFLRDGCIN